MVVQDTRPEGVVPHKQVLPPAGTRHGFGLAEILPEGIVCAKAVREKDKDITKTNTITVVVKSIFLYEFCPVSLSMEKKSNG